MWSEYRLLTYGTFTSNSFLQGLSHISSDALVRARGLVAEHMIHTLPLRDAHLKVLLIATVKMDLNAHLETAHDCLSRYINKLTLQYNSINSRDCTSSEKKLALGMENLDSYDWTSTSIRELSRRQSAVSCILSLQNVLSAFPKTIRNNVSFQANSSILREQLKNEKFSMYEVSWLWHLVWWRDLSQMIIALALYMNLILLFRSEHEMEEFITWNRWKSRNLMYFLDKRTIRLVSGVSMLFSSPKSQWLRLFECLAKSDNLQERGVS